MQTKMLWLLVWAALAQAEELQFDLAGRAYTADGASGPFDISFMLDTMSGTSLFVYDSSGCLAGFSTDGVPFSNLSASVSGRPVITGNHMGGYSGGGIVNAALWFQDGSNPSFWEFGGQTGPGCFAGNDPLADLFLSTHPASSGVLEDSSGAGWNLTFDRVSVTRITHVPEPATLALFVLGLAGIALTRWK